MKFPLQAIYEFYRNTIRNPKYRWWIILGTLVYLLSPIDISPDVFPIVGEIDDLLLVTLMMSEVSQILWEKVRKNPQATTEAESETASYSNHSVVDVDAVSIK